MWHFTDVFYHTDGDRLSMVSSKEMKNVGVSALAAAFTLCAADENTAMALIDEVTQNAIDRLQIEFALSKEAIQKGAVTEKEQHILEVWNNWYQVALAKMIDIPVTITTVKMTTKIDVARQLISNKSKELMSALVTK